MSEYIHLEVESSHNNPMSANLVFKSWSEPFRVAFVRIFDGEPAGRLCAVTGWSSENGGSAVDAYAASVSDSGSGTAFLVYGGDLGIRLRPADAEAPWDVANPDQWGETHLVLADAEDLIAP